MAEGGLSATRAQPPAVDGPRLRRSGTVFAALFADFGVVLGLVNLATAKRGGQPFDFDINLVGRRRLLEHRDLHAADVAPVPRPEPGPA
jgi:hypothetical protein